MTDHISVYQCPKCKAYFNGVYFPMKEPTGRVHVMGLPCVICQGTWTLQALQERAEHYEQAALVRAECARRDLELAKGDCVSGRAVDGVRSRRNLDEVKQCATK